MYRRICFLRSEGLSDEAQLIEMTEFAEAAARARESSGSAEEADTMLKALLSEEQERVASAIAFAEVLEPMLAKRHAESNPPIPRPAAASPARKQRIPGRDESRGIADFIDDMLAQERTGSG